VAVVALGVGQVVSLFLLAISVQTQGAATSIPLRSRNASVVQCPLRASVDARPLLHSDLQRLLSGARDPHRRPYGRRASLNSGSAHAVRRSSVAGHKHPGSHRSAVQRAPARSIPGPAASGLSLDQAMPTPKRISRALVRGAAPKITLADSNGMIGLWD
jgi:hypothetical protein